MESRGILWQKIYPRVDEGYVAKRSYCYSKITLSINCLLLKQTESSFDKGDEVCTLTCEVFFFFLE